MIDGIPEEDFDDDFFDEGDGGMYGSNAGKKTRHVSGIEGVVISESSGYYWVAYGGGQQAFICGNELSTKGDPTPAELEAYLGHANGLPEKAFSKKSVESV